MIANTLENCAADVRRLDPDRWLTLLLAPPDRQPALAALYAFNLEIARVAEQVSEPMLGAIRLQWWRETLAGIRTGTPRKHPVAEALHRAGAAAWSDSDFLELIDARERDLDPAPMADMAALLGYAEATSAPLMRLAVQALGLPVDAPLAETIRLAGTAYALTGILRAVPFHAAQQRVLLPESLLVAGGIAPEEVYRRPLGTAAFAAMREAGLEAARRIAMARRRPVPRAALPALLPLRLAALHLRRLERAGFDPSDPRLTISQPRKQIALLGAMLRGKP